MSSGYPAQKPFILPFDQCVCTSLPGRKLLGILEAARAESAILFVNSSLDQCVLLSNRCMCAAGGGQFVHRDQASQHSVVQHRHVLQLLQRAVVQRPRHLQQHQASLCLRVWVQGEPQGACHPARSPDLLAGVARSRKQGFPGVLPHVCVPVCSVWAVRCTRGTLPL